MQSNLVYWCRFGSGILKTFSALIREADERKAELAELSDPPLQLAYTSLEVEYKV
jgi:hypothetical protein